MTAMTIKISNGVANVYVNYKSKKRLKLVVRCGKQSTHYDVMSANMILPLTFGNGTYVFALVENITGNTYANIATQRYAMHSKNINSYRLRSNDYVSYNESSTFYQTAKSLKTFDAIKDYIIKNFHYDYISALLTKKNNFEPADLEKCFQERKGICDDLAALTVAFARINNIPAALVIGTANNNSHAWVEIDGKIFDPTIEVQRIKRKYEYIPERYY